MINPFPDPSTIDTSREARAVTFENPTGAKGAGGTAHGGRKGAPNKIILPGEVVPLMDMAGPGRIHHIWLTVPPMPPAAMRRLILEVRYDGAEEPSISVPMPDFFGASLGRPVELTTALTAIQEGRGFNSTIPMPFQERIEMRLINASDRRFPLYYQIDLTLGDEPQDAGLLHAHFNRQNPTTMKDDFVITDGLKGPGRYLGVVCGMRVLNEINAQHRFSWYGEGEVKMFIDGDQALPTICGTGLEDYAGTAWGMGAHQAPWSGVPHEIKAPDSPNSGPNPDFASFYRWHVPDPVPFREDIKVTLQQIGAVFIPPGGDDMKAEVEANHEVAGAGWTPMPGNSQFAIVERQDDVSAVAFLYLTNAQGVPPCDPDQASADLDRKDYETAHPMEAFMSQVGGFSE